MTSKNKRISLKGIFQIILILILGATVLAACIVAVIKHQNAEAEKGEQKARISAAEKIVKKRISGKVMLSLHRHQVHLKQQDI